MTYGGRGYRYGIDVTQYLSAVGKGGTVVPARQRFGLFNVGINNGRQGAFGELVIDLGVNRPHLAGADYCCTYLIHFTIA